MTRSNHQTCRVVEIYKWCIYIYHLDLYGGECFKTFIKQIKSMHSTIKFTAEWSYRSVSFLHVQNTSNKEGHLVTNLYTKPRDTHQYLHRQACHPLHCKATIAYSQALRLRQICSWDEDYHQRVQDLNQYRSTGDMEKWRHNDKYRANGITREEALWTSGRKTADRISLVVGYHPNLPPLSKILHDYLQKKWSWQHWIPLSSPIDVRKF